MLERGLLDTGREDCWRRRMSQIADLNVFGLKELACLEISTSAGSRRRKSAAVINPLRNDRGKIH
jgi:hypothetical protein